MLRHLRNLIAPLFALAAVIGIAYLLFVQIFGYARFRADFIPLDTSRIGPNLCASIFLVVCVIAHNEFVVVRKAEQMHESHKQLTRDVMHELLHPTDQAEADIADAVAEARWTRVLDQLDETTPGGLGTVLARLVKP